MCTRPKQAFDLGQEVFVFRAQKGELVSAKGIVKVAEIDRSGYVLYTVEITLADGQKDAWRANYASLATSEDELNIKMSMYKQFNEEQKKKYVEIFGAPEFDPTEIGL